jgi:inosine/xanthosine triphosphatase
MQIVVGSKNQSKVAAVKEFFSSFTADLELLAVTADSEVSSQPRTLAETIRGARNRAHNAWNVAPDCFLSIGIEGGITPIEYTHTGYMNICAAVLYSGSDYFTGLSSGFEHPKAAIDLVLTNDMEIRDAYVQAGLEKDVRFSTAGGAIGFMTDGRLTRSQYCGQALQMAYAAFEKRDYLRS